MLSTFLHGAVYSLLIASLGSVAWDETKLALKRREIRREEEWTTHLNDLSREIYAAYDATVFPKSAVRLVRGSPRHPFDWDVEIELEPGRVSSLGHVTDIPTSDREGSSS